MRAATSTPWPTSDRTWAGKRSSCASAWPQTTAWPGPDGALTLSRLATLSTFVVVGRHPVQRRQRRRQFRLHLLRRRRRQFRLHRHQVVYPAGRPALLCPLPPQQVDRFNTQRRTSMDSAVVVNNSSVQVRGSWPWRIGVVAVLTALAPPGGRSGSNSRRPRSDRSWRCTNACARPPRARSLTT